MMNILFFRIKTFSILYCKTPTAEIIASRVFKTKLNSDPVYREETHIGAIQTKNVNYCERTEYWKL